MGFLAGHVSRASAPAGLLAAARRVQHRLAHRGARQAAWSAWPVAQGTALLLSGAEARLADIHVAFDGCLTNRAELEERLLAEGRILPGHGDAELVAAGWKAWGEELLPRLQGAFALAVLDSTRGRLVLARDRFGERPLLVAATPQGALTFASELPTLLAWPGIARTPDLEVLAWIMAFGHAPADRSPIAGVRRLRPGHMLTVEPDGSTAERCWWALPAEPGGMAVLASATLTERIIATVRAACAATGVVELSGGAGGMLLAACFEAPRGAPAAAQPGAPDPGLIRRLVWHGGEPIAPEEVAPALAAGGRCGVVAAPAGAAELLLAHRRYGQFAQDLARSRQMGGASAQLRTGGLHDGKPTARDLWHAGAGAMTEAERLELAGPALMHTLVFAMPDAYGLSLEEAGASDAMARAARLDLACRVPARDLPSLQAVAALTGASFVCPFLDGRLVELLAGLPDAARRWLLPVLPPTAGLAAVNLSEWHPMAPGLREFTQDTLLGAASRSRDLFSIGRVEALLRRHAAAPGRDPRALWAMLGIELWCQTFLGASLDAEQPEEAANDIVLPALAAA